VHCGLKAVLLFNRSEDVLGIRAALTCLEADGANAKYGGNDDYEDEHCRVAA
jgi:hypothetical protein